MVCQRCQGLLVCDTFYDLNIKTDPRYTATRCINCGHMEDAVVRANRVRTSLNTQVPPHGRVTMGNAEGIKIHLKEPGVSYTESSFSS